MADMLEAEGLRASAKRHKDAARVALIRGDSGKYARHMAEAQRLARLLYAMLTAKAEGRK